MPPSRPKESGSLAERTQATSAFLKAIDDLNAAAEKCFEAGLYVRCQSIDDPCIKPPQWIAAIEGRGRAR